MKVATPSFDTTEWNGQFVITVLENVSSVKVMLQILLILLLNAEEMLLLGERRHTRPRRAERSVVQTHLAQGATHH